MIADVDVSVQMGVGSFKQTLLCMKIMFRFNIWRGCARANRFVFLSTPKYVLNLLMKYITSVIIEVHWHELLEDSYKFICKEHVGKVCPNFIRSYWIHSIFKTSGVIFIYYVQFFYQFIIQWWILLNTITHVVIIKYIFFQNVKRIMLVTEYLSVFLSYSNL